MVNECHCSSADELKFRLTRVELRNHESNPMYQWGKRKSRQIKRTLQLKGRWKKVIETRQQIFQSTGLYRCLRPRHCFLFRLRNTLGAAKVPRATSRGRRLKTNAKRANFVCQKPGKLVPTSAAWLAPVKKKTKNKRGKRHLKPVKKMIRKAPQVVTSMAGVFKTADPGRVHANVNQFSFLFLFFFSFFGSRVETKKSTRLPLEPTKSDGECGNRINKTAGTARAKKKGANYERKEKKRRNKSGPLRSQRGHWLWLGPIIDFHSAAARAGVRAREKKRKEKKRIFKKPGRDQTAHNAIDAAATTVVSGRH